jgi:predicted molibdopterin-dependent oxidoreductase YjgC
MEHNRITINGHAYDFEPGQTILEVAQQNHIDIPNLCHLKGTRATGACRVCIVELEESWGRKIVSSCSAPAKNGMIVHTESPKIVAYRKFYIGLMLDSGNHNCDIGARGDESWTDFQISAMENDQKEELCPVWGDCELQALAYRYQVKGRVSGRHREAVTLPIEEDNPFIIRDMSRCILCGRCVAACNEVQVNQAIDFGFRGTKEQIIAGTGTTLMNSALGKWRPWEVTKIRTTCPYCGVGCQQLLHVKDDTIIKVTGIENAAPNQGRLCVKGRFGYDFIHSDKRLKTPLIREKDGFREASWDEALTLVADTFTRIIDESGPDALAGVSCARSINEDSYQMQKLFRAVFKTNNIDHCART